MERDTSWVALLGRQDAPTDGVEDYCIFLGGGLSTLGIQLQRVRVPWLDRGWIAALRELSREIAAWRGQWVLIQYTAFSWSRRGFPFPVLIVLALLRRGGVRVAIAFHEPRRQGGVRWIDRLRGACQDWVIRRLYRKAQKSVFTVPLETVSWLPRGENKAIFIPIGANLPECVNHRTAPAPGSARNKIIVFGVTGAPNGAREIEEIADVMRQASEALGPLQLIVVGRGSMEAREGLARNLNGCNIALSVKGILPAEDVASEFEQADALLFVRGTITPQRGSAIAGIACGLPIVGYGNCETAGPLKDAGVEWCQSGDSDALARGLIRVLSDPGRWLELHEHNLAAQRDYFSWSKIAEKFYNVLNVGEANR